MASAPFPGPGPDDGDPPPPLPPGVPARDETGCGGRDDLRDGQPGGAGDDGAGDDDWDADADLARFLDDVDAGRVQVPEEGVRGPAVTFSVGETADVDPAVLAAMAGPDGLGGQTFDQGKAAGALRPGPLLCALTEQAARDPRALAGDELLGLISAARRLQNRAEYLELTGIGEFTRRRAAELADATARKVPRGARPGEFADQELAMELTETGYAAGERMELAAALATRLPQTFAGMAAGLIDGGRAAVIGFYTRILSDEQAGYADAVLAAAAPGLRYDQLSRKAAALEMKLDPEGVRRRKEDARRQGARVEARREASGNMSYAGRELASADVLGARALIEADAAALRAGGLAGSLAFLRSVAFTDRLTGRNPLDRLTATPDDTATPDASTTPDVSSTRGGSDTEPGGTDSGDRQPGGGQPSRDPVTAAGPHPAGPAGDGEDDQDEDRPGTPAGPHPAGPVPLPALINLIVPAGLLLGWSAAPAGAGGWGLLDRDDARQLIQAASTHPRTRWCVTITGPDGTAIAHGCARGRHPWTPAPAPAPGSPAQPQHPGTNGSRDGPASTTSPPSRDGPGSPRDPTGPPGPDPDQAAHLAHLLRGLNVAFTPIATGHCDHRHREDRYTPGRTLKHLVRARNTTCTAPGCAAQAYYCDLDHTIPWPDGMTCECDLGPKCRRHHRCKQAPGWRVEQPEPGVFRWTTPSGRSYTTTPTVYDL